MGLGSCNVRTKEPPLWPGIDPKPSALLTDILITINYSICQPHRISILGEHMKIFTLFCLVLWDGKMQPLLTLPQTGWV